MSVQHSQRDQKQEDKVCQVSIDPHLSEETENIILDMFHMLAKVYIGTRALNAQLQNKQMMLPNAKYLLGTVSECVFEPALVVIVLANFWKRELMLRCLSFSFSAAGPALNKEFSLSLSLDRCHKRPPFGFHNMPQ